MRLCVIAGCGRKHKSKGLCSMHLRRVTRHGDPGPAEAFRRYRAGQCEVAGCDRPAVAKGLCWTHYLRHRRHGTEGEPELRSRPWTQEEDRHVIDLGPKAAHGELAELAVHLCRSRDSVKARRVLLRKRGLIPPA